MRKMQWHNVSVDQRLHYVQLLEANTATVAQNVQRGELRRGANPDRLAHSRSIVAWQPYCIFMEATPGNIGG